MNGIDIASYQTGIDLTKVPCDFVIVKATQGTGYTNPDFKRAVEQGLNAGKCIGAYHYAGGGDPTNEAYYFLKTIKPYIGKAILCLDWESSQNPAFGAKDLAWVKEWISVVSAEAKTTPFLYISSSRIKWFASIADKFKLWAAQYAGYDTVNGYQEHPWNEGAYECAIRQYTSSGYLPGWWKRLDLNKAYITREEWMALAGGEHTEAPKEEPKEEQKSMDIALPILSRSMENEKRDDVKAFQALHNLRFGAKLSVDGYYGPRSEEACKYVQKAYGLDVDGMCGPQTFAALIKGNGNG